MGVHLLDHPLIQHKVTILRDRETGAKDFRDLVEEISTLMAYEATRHLTLEETSVRTPLAVAKGKMIAGKKLGLVPILRAGLGMVNGIVDLIPAARVGHLGIYREHDTLKPVEYYAKLPEDLSEREIFLLDPMLATGGSAVAAVSYLRQMGAKSITFICLISSREGIRVLQESHPDVEIFTAAIDEVLNENGYIVPGLGDAGDRLFGTK